MSLTLYQKSNSIVSDLSCPATQLDLLQVLENPIIYPSNSCPSYDQRGDFLIEINHFFGLLSSRKYGAVFPRKALKKTVQRVVEIAKLKEIGEVERLKLKSIEWALCDFLTIFEKVCQARSDLFVEERDEISQIFSPLLDIHFERIAPSSLLQRVWSIVEDFLFSTPEKEVEKSIYNLQSQLKGASFAYKNDPSLEAALAADAEKYETEPCEISPRAKRVISTVFTLLQLGQNIAVELSRPPLFLKNRAPLVKNTKIDKEEAFLGTYLQDKLYEVRNLSDKDLLRLAKKYPKGAPYLRFFRDHTSEEPDILAIRSELRSSGFQGVPPTLQRPADQELVRAVQAQTEQLKEDLQGDTCTALSFWEEALPYARSYSLEQREEAFAHSIQQVKERLFPRKDFSDYGNKHANLMVMQAVQQALKLKVTIPTPRGISSDAVYFYLKEKAAEIFDLWKSITSLEDVEDKLEKIEKAIDRAFEEEDFPLPVEMLFWLSDLEKKGSYLMVRSTGAEDSLKAANAGGNVSRAYVEPTRKALVKAAKEVVQSYFGKASLQNRINAGLNPFQEDLRLAVTVQELIGEPLGGSQNPQEIPVSFVLFTNEPLYYIGGEPFRAMRISATYGHGEAVVSSQEISSDTILILQSQSQPKELYILYDNQIKPTRLAPVSSLEKVVLAKTDNPEIVQKKRCFNQKELIKLYHAAICIESYQGVATDIEGVMKNGEIYFVQARPVIRKPLLPTYLDVAQLSLEKYQAESLVPGKASVYLIEDPSEVLLAPTLEEAEKRFSASSAKLIIVQERAPVNSHPVVNFSGLNIPCLYVKEVAKVREMLRKVSSLEPLAVCMQTASLTLWKQEIGAIFPYIKEGFAVHPAKLGISVGVTTYPITPMPPSEELENLFSRLGEKRTQLEALNEIENLSRSMRKELEELKKTLPENAHQEILGRVFALEELGEAIFFAIEEMRTSIRLSHPDRRLKELLHLKILQSLFFQEKDPLRLGSYCYLDAASLIEDIKELISYSNQLGHAPRFIDQLLFAHPGNARAFASWKETLLSFESLFQKKSLSLEEIQKFKEQMQVLQEAGVFPLWLTFFSSPKINLWGFSPDQIAIEKFKSYISDISSQDQELIESFIKGQKRMEQLSSKTQRFGDPAQFRKAKQELFQEIESYVTEEQIVRIKSSSSIAQLVAYETLEKGIDLLDRSIKAMKASPSIPDAQKLENMKEMLNFSLWFCKTLAFELVDLSMIKRDNINTSHEKYFYNIDTILNRIPHTDPKELLPSPNFSVSAARLGSRAVFTRHKPQTLEDILTLLHQNSLVCIEAMNQKEINPENIENSLLPSSLKQMMEIIEKASWPHPIQRMGIRVGKEKIILDYNIPLRDHSGRIAIYFDPAEKEAIFHGLLLGLDETGRWGDVAKVFEMLQKAKVVPSSEYTSLTNQEVSFSWRVNLDNIKYFLELYQGAASYSLSREDSDIYRLVLERSPTHANHRILLDYLSSLEVFEPAAFFIAESYLDTLSKDNLQQIQALATFAEKQALDPNFLLDSSQIAVFKKLVDRGQAFETAIEVANKASLNGDWWIRSGSQKLFQALVDKGRGIKEAIDFAAKGVLDLDPESGLRRQGLILFKALVEKGYGIEEAVWLASKAVADSNALVKANGLDLFDILTDQNYAIEAARQAAKQGILDSDPKVSGRASELFNKLGYIHKRLQS